MNSNPLFGMAALAATLFVIAPATSQVQRFGGDGDRKATSHYFWDKGANKLVGGYSITYGSPEWKKEREADVNSDKDGSLRLGSDGWATLDTFVPLTIGGVKIPAGQWFLGLRREAGKFSLMVLDAAKIRRQKVAPWMTHTVKARIHAPFTHAKTEASEDKLRISAAHGDENPTAGTLTVRWGNHELKAPVVVNLAKSDVKTSNAASRKKAK